MRTRLTTTALAVATLSACSTDAPGRAPLATAPASSQNDASFLVHVASTGTDVIGTFSGVTVTKSGLGSAIAPVPGSSRSIWMLTDRGPNIDGPNGSKVFPDPSYAPRLYRAHLSGEQLRVDAELLLRRADGTPLTGLPIGAGQCGSTGEAAFDLAGQPIPFDPQGLDSEGLVALSDGTFWVSDEYGPFLAHFDATGRQIERLTPCGSGIPEVYKLRRPNRGMEGLTVTPNGEWLVGIMQAPLENPSRTGIRNISRLTRLLFRNLADGTTKEYAYIIDRGDIQGNSEILALSSTRFLVLERDGHYLLGSPASTIKRLYEIDITGATDISTLGALGATPIGGTKTLEQATLAELTAAGVVPVSKTLALDLLPFGYTSDKPEGIALMPGNMLFVANDDDFGINGAGTTGTLIPKIVPGLNTVDRPTVWQFKWR